MSKTILHITEALGGGISTLLSEIANQQVRDGYKVILIYSKRQTTPDHLTLMRLFPEPIEMVELPMVTNISPIKDLRSISEILYKIFKYTPDVIHLHSSKAGVLGRVAALLSFKVKKVYYSPHGLSFLRTDISNIKRKLFLVIERVAAKLGGVIIASSETENSIINNCITRRSKLVVNGINTDKIIVKQRSECNSFLIGTTGRITYAKDPGLFLKIAIYDYDEKVKFKWFGDGELKDNFFTGENAKIVTGWLKEHSDVLRKLSTLDIFILTSKWEGMPISLIEAQIAGIPCLVTDVPGARDVVKDGVNGYICHGEDEFISKIKYLINNPDKLKVLGKTRESLHCNVTP